MIGVFFVLFSVLLGDGLSSSFFFFLIFLVPIGLPAPFIGRKIALNRKKSET